MRIAILGAGRMGSWLARILARDHHVIIGDTDPSRARGLPMIPSWSDNDELAAFMPEMLVNCVPLGSTVNVFGTVMDHLPETCMLSDIASVKTGLAEYYAGTGRPFVSTHPMFGPSYADETNLKQQNAVIIKESCEAGKAFFSKLYTDLGIRIFEESFEEHDRTVAYSLATPFTSTMVFAACMKDLDAPGTNFRKHLEIARGLLAEDDTLLAEILFNPYTVRQIELINSQLSYLTHIIKDRDRDEMDKFLGKLRTNIGMGKSQSGKAGVHSDTL
ncbi:MAG: prephenate dehydrogenase/arogenate dehydrogenase family protein [Spirochaetia bacterium]|jgi:prephenate dehydrogenase|nr:prephenate dehydrogenase/arogenate dehydrogenase family protein [Spirochaetia bacterium]